MTAASKQTGGARKGSGQTDVAIGIEETFVLLDNSAGSAAARSLLFTNPVGIIEANMPEEVGPALARLDAALMRGEHAAGFFGYELGYAMEPRLAHLMPPGRTVPLLWLGLYRPPREMTSAAVEAWLAHRTSGPYEFTDVTRAWDGEAYLRRFTRVAEYIRAGDIYQLNLTFKARFSLTGSPLAFYRDLRQRQRVAYAGIVDTGAVTVLSASPELFLEMDGRTVKTRPMKGTSPRGATPAADAEAARILSTDAKQRAENLMIVDLMRNDLGRIAEIGSVHVSDLFTVETFRTLHQMTSGVEATLKPGFGAADLLRAVFPPGSVTGAPKIRAMELIAELESEPRGVYCGAIGHIAPSGRAMLNVAIRTPVVFRDGSGEMGIGSGVVFDSVGPTEYAECLLKMKFLTDPPKAFSLIETVLYDGRPGAEPSGFWLLDEHMRRLTASAAFFRLPLEAGAAEAALWAAIKGREDERLRVRLTLDERGQIDVTVATQPGPAEVMRYVVSPTRISTSDVFLYHKTTRRELYDREWQESHERYGADEVVYLNERGEIAEGSRTNIFVRRGGRLQTPLLASGLLPGTLRAAMLARGEAEEAVLFPADLAGAEGVYLGNSVRGLVRAEPLPMHETHAAHD
jgi:para-aminobenzoate synthetase / 4-amino-4-deoxychorismate lyase